MVENIIFKRKENIKYGVKEYANYYVVVAEIDGKDKYNILENDKLMLDTWMDLIDDYSSNHDTNFNGCIRVRLNNKENIFNVKTKKFVYDKPYKDWFDGVSPYCCVKYIAVYRYKDNIFKANLLNSTNGKIISKVWYYEAYGSDNYPRVVKIVDKREQYNFLDEKGHCISSTWFGHVYPFEETDNGLQAIVTFNGKSNVIKPDGNYISKQWFDNISDRVHHTSTDKRIVSYEVAQGNLWKGNNLFNHMRSDGTLLSETWWPKIRDIDPIGYIAETEKGKVNIVTRSGKLISDEWFNEITFETLHWTRDQYVDVATFKLYCDDGTIKHIRYNPYICDYEIYELVE